ncbi:YopX family protein [Campylobacter sp.]|uniref:YopX family protein n=1 Tax=Campylobacter sp. TaxID=205 RepID=UPI0029130852|nr:YopX family protein [Campylobacter sp.]MDU6827798.1 YopX family protein [Campylobacter sp.]
MKEIKFRAWDVLNKKMLSWGEVFHLPAWEIFPGTPEQRAFEVMQYTGLKDRNGKEIYEGDILELRANPFDRKKDLFQVVFKDGGFRDEWNNYIGQYLPPDIRNKQGGRVRLNEACEVVGNIYENPELLEEDKNA